MLARHRSFADRLSPACRSELQDVLQPLHLKKGETLFAQNELPQKLLLIRKGCIKIMIDTSSGRRVVAELLFEGDFCGVTCTFLESRYPFSAVSVQDSLVATVDRAVFAEIAGRHSELWLAGMASCHAKHQQQQEMLASLAVETSRQRTIRILLFLASRLGRREQQGVCFNMPFDRQELSELVGTTVETLIRGLSQLRKEGHFQERGGVVTLTRPKELANELASFSGCGCHAMVEVGAY